MQVPRGLYKQGSNIWWTNVKRQRDTTGTADLQEAIRILRIRQGRAAEGQPILRRPDQVTYDEARQLLIDYYETSRKRDLKEAGFRLKHLDDWFKKKKLIYIQNYIEGYIKQRWKEGAADATIDRELEVLIKMLHVAYEKNKLMRIPVIHKLKLDNVRQGFFERDMSARVSGYLREDYVTAITIDETYGWRTQSEVLKMEWRMIDFGVGTIRLDPGMTKNDDGRVVYMTAEVNQRLLEQRECVKALERQLGQVIPWVFPHLEGRFRGQRIQDFKKAWKTACQKAGLPGMLRHDYRRTAVRNNERAGVPRSIGMKMTGHRTESVYKRYDIVNDADLKLGRDRLEDHNRIIVGSDNS